MRFFHAILIILFFTPAIWIKAQRWKSVVATVDSTRIERTRPGTPAWSLWVDYRYEVAGRGYSKKNVDVFHDSDRDVTLTEQENWPSGRKITVYRSERNPGFSSLEKDGNLEVSMAIAVILSIATTLVLLPFYLARKRNRAHRAE